MPSEEDLILLLRKLNEILDEQEVPTEGRYAACNFFLGYR